MKCLQWKTVKRVREYDLGPKSSMPENSRIINFAIMKLKNKSLLKGK